jgi:DNA-binding transcriptional LysR family regulator
MQLHSLDIKLLAIFDSVLRHKSLTLAGESMGLTQPAMSQSLLKLRKYFKDPLFVRTTHGMEPTPRALELAEPVALILDTVKGKLERLPAFDPMTSERTFSLSCSDIGAASFVPPILARFKKVAPRAKLRTAALNAKEVRDGLEAGDVDISIGAYPDFGAGIFQQRLYKETVVCVVRPDHPSVKSSLTKDQFAALPHILVSGVGTGHSYTAIEKLLTGLIPLDHIALRLPSFLAAASIVRNTDMILALPRGSGTKLIADLGLKAFDPPIEIPLLQINQYWHERYHHDAAHKWFRGLLAELFMEGEGSKLMATPKKKK